MSLFCAAFFNGNRQIAMAADTRTCTIINGEKYQVSDDMTKLYDNGNGFVFYCSGETEMSKEVASKLFELNTENLHMETIIKILENVYSKHIELNPTIKDFKHTLQLVIPMQIDGLWSVVYFDNENNFEPYLVRAATNEVYVFAIGVGMHVAQPILFNLLNNTNTKKVNVFDTFLDAFSKAADEACGGSLNYMAFTDDGIVNKSAPIPDVKHIKRFNKFTPPMEQGLGDGLILNNDGSNKSGVAKISKPNGLWSFIYNNNNSAQERRLIFQDNGVELSTETGDIIIAHDNGSLIRMMHNGDIEIKSQGKIKITGGEYLFE
ncbi:hypothetical protein MKZ15_06245 [Paenibacillus sp. FSL R7-0216]|uniref:hypothetical protein n=1 Tax=Paenibacillus sp. FSL R7-0216 TaxID=2921677 RepID=UPI0030DB0C5C